MATILMWAGGLNELGKDADFDPPNLQARKTPKSDGSKRHAIVCADDVGETIFPEEALKNRLSAIMGSRWESLASEQETAVAIHDCEGVTIAPIAGPELPFEIGGPNHIGLVHFGRWTPWMAGTMASTPFSDEIILLQIVVCRGR